MRLGVLGIGSMGFPLAQRLAAQGHNLSVWNRTANKIQPLLSKTVVCAENPAKVGAESEVVFSVLIDDRTTEAVVLGTDGLLEGLGPESIHVCCATISPSLADRLTETHAELGQYFVSAPLLGRPEAVADGSVFVVAAGAERAIRKVKPLLEAISQRLYVVADQPSHANVIKLANNLLIMSVIESLSEAAMFVEQHGIESRQLLEVLTRSNFSSPIYRTYGAIITEHRYLPAGFPLSSALKDVKLILDAAEAGEVALPIASLVRDRILEGLARGYGEYDWAVFGRGAK